MEPSKVPFQILYFRYINSSFTEFSLIKLPLETDFFLKRTP